MSQKEKTRVAVHEMGHALVAHFSENLDPVHRVTIIPRGTAALGLTMTRPLEDRYLATEPELKDMLAFAMGGRVAEELVFDEISHGRPERPGEGHPDRARDGLPVRHERQGRPPVARPRRPQRLLRTRPQDLRAHGREDRRRGPRACSTEAHDQAERHPDASSAACWMACPTLLLAVETIEGDDLEAYTSGTKPIPDAAALARETQKQEEAAAVATEREERKPAAARVVLPPAPPMPTVD